MIWTRRRKNESRRCGNLCALAWLAGNDDLLPVFLGSTGADLAELRSRANDAQFLGSVLDFLLLDDTTVLAFATEARVKPTEVIAARAALPGGEAVHWT